MIQVCDILPPAAYERVRAQQRPELLRHKQQRRVELGRYLCLLFESRETVLQQIHEVVRAENRTHPDQIQREIDEYACLVPSPGRLTATLTIQAGGAELGAALAAELDGARGPVALELGARRYPCAALRPEDRVPTAVYYVGFAFDEDLLPALRSSAPASLRLDSGIERCAEPLPEPLRAALVETLLAISSLEQRRLAI